MTRPKNIEEIALEKHTLTEASTTRFGRRLSFLSTQLGPLPTSDTSTKAWRVSILVPVWPECRVQGSTRLKCHLLQKFGTILELICCLYQWGLNSNSFYNHLHVETQAQNSGHHHWTGQSHLNTPSSHQIPDERAITKGIVKGNVTPQRAGHEVLLHRVILEDISGVRLTLP